jgi:hydroxypyruvate isomerase
MWARQLAAVPDRSEPDRGEVAYDRLLPAMAEIGYGGCFGAEYKPVSGSFKWLERWAAR